MSETEKAKQTKTNQSKRVRRKVADLNQIEDEAKNEINSMF